MVLDLPIVAHEILSAALFFTVFGRAVKSCEKVRTDVRLAFFLLGIVSCVGMAAPLAWGFAPDAFCLALLAAIVCVQITTSLHWSDGVPERFLKTAPSRQRRRVSDKGMQA